MEYIILVILFWYVLPSAYTPTFTVDDPVDILGIHILK